MDGIEARQLVRDMDIDKDEKSLVFKAAVILICGLGNNTVSYSKLKRITNYWWKEVVFILHNFWANGIIYKYQWNLDNSLNEEEWFFEIILCSMAGASEIVRYDDAIIPEEKRINWDDFLTRIEFCYGQATAISSLKLPKEECLKRNNEIRENRKIKWEPPTKLNSEDNETPLWLLEKQKRIKEIAKKINQQ